ncbi:MAG TPA: tetratricopeptide repeat protein [bacterium]
MRTGCLVLIVMGLALPPAGVAQAAAKTDWTALAAQYTQVLTRYPADVHTRYNLAMVYAHEGRVVDGWRELQAVERYLEGKREPFGIQVIRESRMTLARSPDDILAPYRLAFALWLRGQKYDGQQEFERIVVLEPNHSWSLAYLGYTYADGGNLDRAIALWERGSTADPSNSILHYVLGLAYTRKGQLRRAASHFAAAYRDRTLYEYVKGPGNK